MRIHIGCCIYRTRNKEVLFHWQGAIIAPTMSPLYIIDIFYLKYKFPILGICQWFEINHIYCIHIKHVCNISIVSQYVNGKIS